MNRPSSGVVGASRVLAHVVAEDPRVLEQELEAAVAAARDQAAPAGCGIVVTRHSRGLFTVALSQQVPPGITVERDRWNRISTS